MQPHNHRRMPSYRAVRTIVLLGLIVIVMSGIGIWSLLHPRPQSEQSTASFVTDVAKVCTDNAKLDAPAYDPHNTPPMALYARSGSAGGGHYQAMYVLGTAAINSDLATAYTTVGRNLTDTNAKKTLPQLVACVDRSNETPTDQTCTYDDGMKIPVDTADYDLHVYESRTHKLIKSAHITTVPNYTCTSFTTYDGTAFYHTWSTADVALALYPLVK